MPVTIMFGDISYYVDPEDCHINAAPLTGVVFKRDNVEVYKFLKYLTQGNEAWKWIDNFKGLRDDMKSLREHYYGSAKGRSHMNTTKADLKDLYFKRQDVFPFEKYVNRLK